MREIKFKAQRLDGKWWVVGDLFNKTKIVVTTASNKGYLTEIGSNSFMYEYINIKPDTVCQFIQRRKENDIFKGDIVIVQGTKRIGLYQTEIIEKAQGFSLKENKTNLNDDACFIAIKEVIGNIHD